MKPRLTTLHCCLTGTLPVGYWHLRTRTLPSFKSVRQNSFTPGCLPNLHRISPSLVQFNSWTIQSVKSGAKVTFYIPEFVFVGHTFAKWRRSLPPLPHCSHPRNSRGRHLDSGFLISEFSQNPGYLLRGSQMPTPVQNDSVPSNKPRSFMGPERKRVKDRKTNYQTLIIKVSIYWPRWPLNRVGQFQSIMPRKVSTNYPPIEGLIGHNQPTRPSNTRG